MKRLTFLVVCLASAGTAAASATDRTLPTAESVMARVAANQDRAEEARAHYIYVQHARMMSRRGDKVMCEEVTDYRMTPTSTGYTQQLLHLDGRLLKDHRYLTYHSLKPSDDKDKPTEGAKGQAPKEQAPAGQQPKEQFKEDKGGTGSEDAKKDRDPEEVLIGDEVLDRDLVENMRQNLTHDDSKDGLTARLFPLTTKDQQDYSFRMVGQERMNGRDTWHITFRPKKKDDFGWKGDAYVDMESGQPVLVTTGMARKVPFAVRTFLGTNLPGLGFTVTYAPQGDGVWFPASFSTEFKINVLFFFHRQIVLDAQNRSFEKTHVTSRIVGDAAPVEDKQP